MPLTTGQLLSHYRIDRKIGQGGMGEVWAATDTRLNRPAAIKALPPTVAADPERLARFKREAQMLAALSHPNIAAIYGLEEIGGEPYLALELVEGEDLSARIEGRRVPPDEAIEIALQIAAALEEAHEKGIIHRDLKPANIKISSGGKVKVLDFGLAKALSADPAASGGSLDMSLSPTMTAAMGTQVGMILGTAGYMAPEQARGKTVDRRADIWAFGVILFEMLTGERLYTGETVTDVIAAVVTREPDWGKLPTDTPVALRRVLQRCMQKDPRKRLRDIGDAALELAAPSADDSGARPVSPAARPAASRSRWLVGVACLVLGAVATWTVREVMTPRAEAARPVWSSLAPPAGSHFEFIRFLEISPDGRRVAFVAPAPAGGERLLWVRDLDVEQPRALAGTEGAEQPFWSPDSQSIGYFAARKLRRVSADGGVSQTLADAGTAPRGAAWGADGTILFVPDWSKAIFRISATGGTPTAVTKVDQERLELSHRWPHMLPDGRHFLYFVVSTYPDLNPANPSELDKSGLYIASLDGTEPPRLLSTARSRAVYRNGSLLYVDDGILMARPFDLGSLSFSGEAVSLAEGVTQAVDALWGGALFSVSDDKSLLFVRGAPQRRSVGQLRWRDREGKDLGALGEVQPFNNLRLSHDGRHVTTSIGDPGDLWIHDVARGTSTRFTFDPGNDEVQLWSPRDDQILFQSSRLISGKAFTPGTLFQKVATGLSPEEQVAVEGPSQILVPEDWSPDGSMAVVTALRSETGSDLMIYSFERHTIEPFLVTNHEEQYARFSPDGRWLAYASEESGRYEIYVQAFPGPGGKWQVSTDGGTRPVWRPDGRELFYLGADHLMAVPVETTGGFRSDRPVALFPNDLGDSRDGANYDISPDGKRFLVMVEAEKTTSETASVTLVQEWRSLLAR